MPQLSYVPFERLPIQTPVERTRFIVEQCRGRAVLDLGCYDETAMVKRGTEYWLHGEICKVARTVFGVDSSENLPPDGLATADNARIVRGNVTDLGQLALPRPIEVIVAGELLEHLPRPLEFLTDLKRQFSGSKLVLTTPNATSLTNGLLGLGARESNHQDHLQVFSYKTLNTLCLRAGFEDWKILAYHVKFTELALRSRGPRRTLVHAAEHLVNLCERRFPLLAGGMILHVSRI